MTNKPKKSSPPSAAPDDEAGIIRGCRALHAAIDQLDSTAADRIGVSRNDLRCLNLLEHGPLAPKAIGAQLGLSSGSMTALIDRLEKKGLVVRRPDPDDRRGILVGATEAVFQQLGPVYRAFAESLLERTRGYSETEKRQAARHFSDAAAACLTAASITAS